MNQWAFSGSNNSFFSGDIDGGQVLRSSLYGAIGGLAAGGAVSPWKTSGFDLSLQGSIGVGALGGAAGGFASGTASFIGEGLAGNGWHPESILMGTAGGAIAGGIVGAGRYYDIQKGSGSPEHDKYRAYAKRTLTKAEKQGVEWAMACKNGPCPDHTTKMNDAVTPHRAGADGGTTMHTHQNQAGLWPFGGGPSPDDYQVAGDYHQPDMALQTSGNSYIYDENGIIRSFNTHVYLRDNYIDALLGY
jgi:hypothetical protein